MCLAKHVFLLFSAKQDNNAVPGRLWQDPSGLWGQESDPGGKGYHFYHLLSHMEKIN